MADKVKVWFDAEGDFLEVRFSDKPGFMREIKNDAVMERVDEEGHLLGFCRRSRDNRPAQPRHIR